MEEDEAEEEEAEHHGEGGRVIRISGDDEAFVLSVLQRSNGDLVEERNQREKRSIHNENFVEGAEETRDGDDPKLNQTKEHSSLGHACVK